MLFVCTTQGCISDEDPKGPSLSVGDSLPDISIVMNNGDIVSTASLMGKVSVIVFFNTNCSDCRKELPVIQSLWEEFKDSDIVILPIARDESAEEIESYWQYNGFTMPYSPQNDRKVYNLFAQSVIPRVYIANTQGVLTSIFDDDKDLPSLENLKEAIIAANKYPNP